MNSILQCLRCSRKLRDIMCAENYMEQKIHAAPRNKGGLAKGRLLVASSLVSTLADLLQLYCCCIGFSYH